jgi:glucose-1-phosphate cytidylyltransferase
MGGGMKVVLLCGGQGSRLGEVTQGLVPKPLVKVAGKPILWHIMSCYAKHGFTDFVVCAGHLGEHIKQYFFNYRMQHSDVRVNTRTGDCEFIGSSDENWSVLVADTGAETMTAGRIQRVSNYLDPSAPFFLTYGDGLCDVDMNALLRFHRAHGKLATITGVAPPGRFGELNVVKSQITEIMEKPEQTNRYINGGFMVLERAFVDRYCSSKDSDTIMLERQPLEQAARDGQLMMHQHNGFWQCMDTMRDWELLNRLALMSPAPWVRA